MVLAPRCVQIIITRIIILCVTSYINLDMNLAEIRYINYDILSSRLILLNFWLIILMIFSQIAGKLISSLLALFCILNLSLVCSFLVERVLLFYFFFEWALIPIFLIIMGWGYQLERLKARMYLLFYTLFASLPLLIVILIQLNSLFNSSMGYLPIICNFLIFDRLSLLIVIGAFLVKFPMFFVHQWLPKAHVEAPVSGSIILAGILLKLGGYGIIRMGYIFRAAEIVSFVISIALVGGAILGIVCVSNSDIKVIIAYSSVVHIALPIMGVLSLTSWGIERAAIIIVAHGICSSGMFSCANIMYERTHSRRIMRNKGSLNYSPRMAIIWFLLCIANLGGPFTLNLLSEVILIINTGFVSIPLLVAVGGISFFSAAYSLILYSRVYQGSFFNSSFSLRFLTVRESMVLTSHIWPIFLIPLSSNIL